MYAGFFSACVGKCPISPPNPRAPSIRFPPEIMPPPTPVPSTTQSTSLFPLAAPIQASARATQLPSLAIVASMPYFSLRGPVTSVCGQPGTFPPLLATQPLAVSMQPAADTPIPSRSMASRPCASRNSSTPFVSVSMTVSLPLLSIGTSRRRLTLPASSTRPSFMNVPPISIPK